MEQATGRDAAEIPGAASREHFDLQDFLLALGVIALEAGVGMLSVPAALILGGALCLFFAWLMERAKKRGTTKS